VPSAAKWHNAGSGTDSVILYVRRADNHLWEAYWPDATNSPNSVSWADLSAITGFGNIVGSPVVADTDQTGRASVVVRKASNNELHTFDWDGGWTTRKVISSGSTAIRTANTVTARAQKTAGFLTFIAGRGLSSTDDATGWIATRSHGSWGTSYTRNANFDHTPNGTPFPASVPELETNLNNYLVARNGSALQAKIIQSGTSWFNLGSCQPTGSPRGASNPYFDPAIDDRGEFLEGFARGRLAGSSENDDLLRWRGLPTNECVSLGGGVYSAPVKFEYVTRFSGLRFNAVYRGTNARLMMWDHLNSQHTHISGITMPGLPP
jgi:hypothetical protein